MKISILEIIGDSSLAGAPRHLLSILEYLDTDNFTLHCICPPGPLAGEIRKLRRHIDLETIKMESRLDFEAIRRIRKEIKILKPDIIHVHGTRAGILGRLAAIGFNIPVIYTEHLWTSQFKLQSRWLNFLHYFANWFLDIFTTQNIAVSQAVKDFMVTSKISRYEKIKVIHNGVEIRNLKANIFQSEQEFLIATVGTLNPQKGVQYLIKALPKVIKEFPGIRLEIVGDGSFKRELLNLVNKLKLKNYVKFTGFVPDPVKYLVKFDLYIQPSLSESFGLAIVQAMDVGLPVIATTTGGIPEVITEGKTGLLVKPEDSEALAEAILELLRHPSLARKMGEMACKEVKLRFDVKDMIKTLEETYTWVNHEAKENSAFAK